MNMETQTDYPPPDPTPSDQTPSEAEKLRQDMDNYLSDQYAYKEPHHGDLRKGVVIQIDEAGLLVDCGFKREGFVPADDLDSLDEETRAGIRPGVEVPVFVVRPENKEGQPILSVQEAQRLEDWLKAEQMMANDELYPGIVSGFNRGGLVVEFGRIRGFVPASQVVGMPRRLPENERRRRLEAMIGKEIGLKIIEVDRYRRRLIFSQRRALRAWQELKREQVINQLTEGEVRHGQVTDITSFGAFVDLGGADGLVHVSELSWKRVDNPREVLSVGQEVDVYVLNIDRERKRIALSLKKLEPDPWTLVDDHYRVGQLVEGRVTRVLDFGAFIELDLGIEGLLHVSEMIGTPELQPAEILQRGDTPLVKIIRIDTRRRRIALSAKQVRQNEWERWMAEQQAARLAAKAEAEAAAIEEAAVEETAETAAPGGEPVAEEPVTEAATVEAAAAVGEPVVGAAAPEGEPAAEEPVAEAVTVEAVTAVDEPVVGAAAPEVADELPPTEVELRD